VESTPGTGSTFTLVLPIGDAGAGVALTVAPEPAEIVLDEMLSSFGSETSSEIDAIPVRGRRVLIVDDDVRNVYALTSALEDRGIEVLYATDGRRGVELLQAHPGIDLVLMDIMMPEMDGYETIRAVRELGRFDDLPIIALTAKAMRGDREKTLAAGASDYITKPVEVDRLLDLMRVWLYR
jgi:CheY-like chemotaxis protein